MSCETPNCNNCTPSALETQLLALDLQAVDVEVDRISRDLANQNELIKEKNEQICSLQKCLQECQSTNKILVDRTRATLGKLRGTHPICR